MAKAILQYGDVIKSPNGFDVPVRILYYGADVLGGTGDFSEVTVTLLGTDTLAQMKSKIINGVLSDAANWGYTLTSANITMPSWMSGA